MWVYVLSQPPPGRRACIHFPTVYIPLHQLQMPSLIRKGGKGDVGEGCVITICVIYLTCVIKLCRVSDLYDSILRDKNTRCNLSFCRKGFALFPVLIHRLQPRDHQASGTLIDSRKGGQGTESTHSWDSMQSRRVFSVAILGHRWKVVPQSSSCQWITFSFCHMVMLDIFWNSNRDPESSATISSLDRSLHGHCLWSL